AVFRRATWTVAYPSAIWGRRLIAIATGGRKGMLEIHTLGAITWRNVTLAHHPAPNGCIGPFKTDSWVSFAKRIVAPLLAGNFERFSVRAEESSATEHELRAAEERLIVLAGRTLARELVTSIREADFKSVRPLIRRLRWTVMLRGIVLHPFRSLRLGSNAVRRKLLQFFSPCAPIIAIVGPDGVGKSTTVKAVQQLDEHVFVDVMVRHWRPGVLPLRAELLGKEIAPGSLHAVRLFYYYLDFLIGGLTKDRIASIQQRLVLYDRCFLDMAVDPLRFGLSSSRGTDLCWRWLPKPDRIILLSDEVGRIHDRNPELTKSEIQRQLDEWQRRAKAGQVHAVIGVHGSRDHVIDRIWEVITNAFVEKNGGLLPSRTP